VVAERVEAGCGVCGDMSDLENDVRPKSDAVLVSRSHVQQGLSEAPGWRVQSRQ